jgi:hypothetical protein
MELNGLVCLAAIALLLTLLLTLPAIIGEVKVVVPITKSQALLNTPPARQQLRYNARKPRKLL